MKAAFCLVAFVVGCFVTVFINGSTTKESETEQTVEQDNPAVAEAPIKKPDVKMGITQSSYGATSDGAEVNKFVCTNKNGLILEMIDYGATVISLQTPDRKGKLANITLNCSDIAGYQACGSYFGSSVGRYCNRIANGKFTIDGKQFSLNTNNAPHHLHGGTVGFDKRMWKAQKLQTDSSVGLRFQLTSKDGDEGYPGKLDVTVDYILNNDNQLIVDFSAKTDKKTHVNLTNHNYWNLAGATSGSILDQQLKIESEKYLPVDKTGIPTGKLVDVKNTPFDFTGFHKIGERIKAVGSDPIGYDHCYALRSQDGTLALAATAKDAESGRVMEVWTTLPGLQFYSGNFLDGQPGSGGFNQHNAFCLESQFYPDTPNQKTFPTSLLTPGDTFHQKTVHKFRVEKK